MHSTGQTLCPVPSCRAPVLWRGCWETGASLSHCILGCIDGLTLVCLIEGPRQSAGAPSPEFLDWGLCSFHLYFLSSPSELGARVQWGLGQEIRVLAHVMFRIPPSLRQLRSVLWHVDTPVLKMCYFPGFSSYGQGNRFPACVATHLSGLLSPWSPVLLFGCRCWVHRAISLLILTMPLSFGLFPFAKVRSQEVDSLASSWLQMWDLDLSYFHLNLDSVGLLNSTQSSFPLWASVEPPEAGSFWRTLFTLHAEAFFFIL
jgi:hypothetical protein